MMSNHVPVSERPLAGAMLELSDGTQWSVACFEQPVIPVIDRLIRVMNLTRVSETSSRCICALYSYSSIPYTFSEDDILIPDSELMSVPEVRNLPEDERNFIDLTRLANRLALSLESSGAILLHTALAEWNGQGVLFAGPSGTGKTTTSSRLPAPWRSLCDEASLVIPVNGTFRAHPWPTMSRIYNGGEDESWDIQESVPLKSIFLLDQAAQDWIEPVRKVDAIIELLQSNNQKNLENWQNLSVEKSRNLRASIFNTASDIVQTVPVFRLHLSLTGSFWKLIEEILEKP